MKQTLVSTISTVFRLFRDPGQQPGRRGTRMSSAIEWSPNAVGFAIALLLSATADGAALKSMSLYGASTALSANPMFKWAASVTRVDYFSDHTQISNFSSVLVAPDVFITAGHGTPRNGSTVAFLTNLTFGSNFTTSSNTYSISGTQRYPGFVFGDPTTIDLGIGRTSSFVSGFTPITFASIPMGGIGTMVDYGNIGDPSTGEMPSLGDRMAGYAPRITDPTSSYPSSLYKFWDFNGVDSANIALNVQGLQGSSGSPIYDSIGNLDSLVTAGTNGIAIGDTVALDLNLPAVQSYLQPIIQDSWNRYNASIPEPTAIGLIATGSLLALQRRRRSGGRGTDSGDED